jgi:hypothetical protein
MLSFARYDGASINCVDLREPGRRSVHCCFLILGASEDEIRSALPNGNK